LIRTKSKSEINFNKIKIREERFNKLYNNFVYLKDILKLIYKNNKTIADELLAYYWIKVIYNIKYIIYNLFFFIFYLDDAE
jgi:hypothetical protein